jgi:hypothetical protein
LGDVIGQAAGDIPQHHAFAVLEAHGRTRPEAAAAAHATPEAANGNRVRGFLLAALSVLPDEDYRKVRAQTLGSASGFWCPLVGHEHYLMVSVVRGAILVPNGPRRSNLAKPLIPWDLYESGGHTRL